jgi:uncharacterized membrane protein YhaH (DUF805 family)
MDWMMMPLRRYADFSGRSQRTEYWMFVLFVMLVLVVGVVLIAAFAGAERNSHGSNEVSPLMLGLFGLLGIFYLGIFVPMLAVQVRRFHDQDLSGWFVLLGFIPYIGGLIVFVFMCIDGTPGTNRFGPDPKGRGDYDAQIFA